VTHISDVLTREAYQLEDREGLQQLLEIVARRSPKIVEELIPTILSHAEVLAVVRALLKEGIGIRDMRAILEGLTEAASRSKSTPYLVDRVRMRLGASITQSLVSPDGKLYVGIFDSQSEDALRAFVTRSETEVALAPDLTTAQNLVTQLQRVMQTHQGEGRAPAIIVPPDLRYPIQHFALRFVAGLYVISQREIPPRVDVTSNLSLTLFPGRGVQTSGMGTRASQNNL
jgi:flagellar biosynthesis protein FlhA